MDTKNLKIWAVNVVGAAKQDPKKAGFLGLLVVLLAVLWGRMLLANSGPAKASASTVKWVGSNGTSGHVVNGAGAVIGGSHAAGNNGFPDSRALAISSARGARLTAADQRLHAWLAEPIRPVSRNLFNVKLEYFPSDGSRPAMGVKTASDGEFWGRLEKSLMLQADLRDKRENLLANYKSEAARLRLDSIMMGPQPKAMIEGKLVAEGDVVAAFRVLKIEARRIVVEREGIRLEIQMK